MAENEEATRKMRAPRLIGKTINTILISLIKARNFGPVVCSRLSFGTRWVLTLVNGSSHNTVYYQPYRETS